ncbi:MAG: DsbA family protein [Candidatus Dormibacteria bacterium]|jgi:predicted DsbA family dithiol-disulfide isomerase
MRIDFFFDPMCPWCWITSRWIVEVEPQRDLEVHWRTFSLLEKNRDRMPAEYLDRVSAGHNALRVAEALRAEEGERAVGMFYTELGARIHHDRVPADEIELATVLRNVGLSRDIVSVADDTKWDTAIRASMDEGIALAGEDVGVPLISFDRKTAYFGPVVTPAPHGDAALQLWDSVAMLAQFPGFYELKNSARAKPEFGQRPIVARLSGSSS